MREDLLMEVGHVSISFGGVQALGDVSLDVKRQEVLGLIGPNGAGKTVLLNCINGIYKPNKGRVVFKGVELNSLSRHKIAPLGIARTFQQVELFKQLSVLDNVLVGSHFRIEGGLFSAGLFWGPYRKREIKARKEAEDIIDFLELHPYRKRLVGSLSYGVQKLVGLARAMAMAPELLLLDEVASGLNREEKEDLARFLLRIQYEKKLTMIWVEHDMEMITQIADRLACLNYGRKIAEGTPIEVVSSPAVIEAYLGAEDQS